MNSTVKNVDQTIIVGSTKIVLMNCCFKSCEIKYNKKENVGQKQGFNQIEKKKLPSEPYLNWVIGIKKFTTSITRVQVIQLFSSASLKATNAFKYSKNFMQPIKFYHLVAACCEKGKKPSMKPTRNQPQLERRAGIDLQSTLLS